MNHDDLTELLDDLEAKHAAASPGEWVVAIEPPCILSVHNGRWEVAYTGEELTQYSSEDAHAIVSAHNALPRLIAALRAVLTFATEERDKIDRTYIAQPDTAYKGYANAMDDVIRTIEDVLRADS